MDQFDNRAEDVICELLVRSDAIDGLKLEVEAVAIIAKALREANAAGRKTVERMRNVQPADMRQRIGRVIMPLDMFTKERFAETQAIMANIVPINCAAENDQSPVEYIALSPYFDVITDGYPVPLYEITVLKNEDGSIKHLQIARQPQPRVGP